MRKSASYLFVVFFLMLMLAAPGCDSLAVIPAGAYASQPPATAPSQSATAAQTASPQPATPEPSPSLVPEPTAAPENTATPEPSTASPEPTAAPEAAAAQMSLLFVGDIMYYSQTEQQQWDAGQNKYDFSSYFENVRPYIQRADFAVANLETPVWDPKKSAMGNFRFAAPPEAIEDLKRDGFDVLTTANNHAMDQGLPALANTIQVIRGNGLMTTGTYRDAQEKDAICMLEKNGMKVALFADTEFLNIDPSEKQGMGVDMLDLKRARQDIQRARDAGADAVIFFLHFGKQYHHVVSAHQKAIVQALRDAGADAVIGAHPHVLQPLLTDPTGGFFAAYSLGSVTTIQHTQDIQFAAMLDLTLAKDPAMGKVTVSKVGYIPTWVRSLAAPGEQPKLRVFDLRQALAECKSGTNPLIPGKYLSELTKGMAMVQKILGAQYLEPTDIQ